MEKTKLQVDFPVETYGGLGDLQVTQPEDVTEELTLAELRELMKTPIQEIPQKIRQNYGGVEGLCTHLLTSTETGLRIDDPSDLDRRRRKFGCNSIPPRKRKSFCYFLLEAIQDTTLIILIIAAIISLGLSFYNPPSSSSEYSESAESADPTGGNAGFIEGIGILVAVVIIVMVTAGINYNKDAQFHGLQKRLADQYQCSVVRSRDVVQLPTSELVVGDICLVEYGDVVPADGVIIRSNDLRLDESSHTGESKDIAKDVNTNSVLYAGTHVIEGSGRMVVTGVGLNSAKGIIFSLLGATENDDAEPEEKRSPLHKKLSSLAMQIAYIGTSLAVLTFLVLMIRFCVDVFLVQAKPWSNAYVQDFVSFIIIGITILVVAVPEGLPLAVILALAYSIKKMVNDKNLVRHLDACEVMGHATTILCDKTGTLTTNKMTVVRSYVAGFTHENASSLRHLPEDTKLLIASSIANNTSYKTQLQGTGKLCTQVGNRTECALLGFVGDLGYDYRYLREKTPEKSFVKVFPFTSAKKWMGTVVPKNNDSPTSGYRLFVKGAWEIVLTRCRWILDSNSEVTELTDERRKMIQEEFVEPMSTSGLRVLAIAYKDFSEDTGSKPHDEKMTTTLNWDDEDEAICCRLVCLAIVGIEDPVRAEVPEAVRKCQKAGITVRMVTGDHMNTARFVAIKCGIFNPGEDHLGIDGPDFNQRVRSSHDPETIDQNLFDELWPRLRILARSSPLDKYNLVKGIMTCPVNHDRQIVAVTGDGTNDGPALRQAHVGLAMGLTGTDVAKEASDIILLDDNFSSIVKAVVWGRHVYDSIAKFIQFQLTVNIVAVALAFIGACVVMDSPLKGVQMLWVNLLMDSLASLSLATEQPTNDVLLRKPYGSSQHIVSCIMAVNILSHSAYELTVLLTILFIGADWLDIDDGRDPSLRGLANSHYTFLFNTFVMMILCNEINARKIDGNQNVFSGLLSSPIFILIWLASFVVQVIIVEVGGAVFFTVKLTWEQWMWSIFLGISDLLYGQLVTFVANIYNRHHNRRQTKGIDLEFSLSSNSSENTEFEMSSSADSAPLYDAAAK